MSGVMPGEKNNNYDTYFSLLLLLVTFFRSSSISVHNFSALLAWYLFFRKSRSAWIKVARKPTGTFRPLAQSGPWGEMCQKELLATSYFEGVPEECHQVIKLTEKIKICNDLIFQLSRNLCS